MAASRTTRKRLRVGRVSVYHHHSAWWLYYREGSQPIRLRVGNDRAVAESQAAEIHSRLAVGTATSAVYVPLNVVSLVHKFLQHHEEVKNSTLSTIRRYAAALQYLLNFESHIGRQLRLHQIPAEAFVAYLRQIEVAPNGHPHSRKRRLRGAGIQFILETCRNLLGFAIRQHHLPPYSENPFATKAIADITKTLLLRNIRFSQEIFRAYPCCRQKTRYSQRTGNGNTISFQSKLFWYPRFSRREADPPKDQYHLEMRNA